MASKIDMSLDDIIKQDKATLVLENKQKTSFLTDHKMGNQNDLRHRIQQSRTAGYHIPLDLRETVDSNQGKSPLLVSPETSHKVIQQMLRRKIQENKAASVVASPQPQEVLRWNKEQNKLLGVKEKYHFMKIGRKKYKKGNQKRLLESLAHTSAMLAQIALQKTASLEKRINRQQLLAARRKRQNQQREAAERPVTTSPMDIGLQGASTPREVDVVVYDLDNCRCEDSVTDNLTVSFPNSPVRSGAQTPVGSIGRNRNMLGLKRTLSVASLNSVPSINSEVCGLPEEPSSHIFKHQAIFPQAATSGQTLHERFSKGPSTSFAFQQ